ncbi:MAG: efflux RND transporter periplasmic adaptor subunit [Nitrospira sp.]|nr:efflux RND transporter periplasmic adaptor subunit [Nitrospira sp.]MDH4251905.1 efflux RND transporter periplasmic adaptor subunit [Nitrospira sp.]MDH4343505.1 efflux RND transporter periplasmic adaptor subunit [Nitrospira sp.]MDH5336379.1 efflux RND transporter periplasmic adaptor subunit [Nitrospira sp.]
MSGLLFGLMVLESGCDGTPSDVVASKSPVAVSTPGRITLSAEESSRVGLVVQPVARSDFRTHRDFPAIVQPNQRNMAEITALVRGRVVEVYGELGQEVKGNAPLAILYSSDLGLAQSAYLKAKAKLHVAEQAFNRAQFLLQEQVIGEAELQRRQAELLSSQAEANESHDRLKLLGMNDEEFRRLESSRKIRSVVPIVAPFAGRIIGRKLTRGEVVETTDNLFVIADLSEVWVQANIPEKDISFAHSIHASGDRQVEVRINAYPKEVFHGTITYVGDVLDPVTRTMQLRIELPNQDGRFKPEMFATIRLFSEAQPDQLSVPEAALQRDQGRTFVFVQRSPNEYELREVHVGESNGTVTAILGGLNEGEPVVTHGAFVLKSELLKKPV